MNPNVGVDFFNVPNIIPNIMLNMNNIDVSGINEEMVKHLQEQNKNMEDLIEKNNIMIEKLMPYSSKKNIEIDLFQDYLGVKINIRFDASSGLQRVLLVPKDIKISELLSAYMKSIKLNDILIDKEIIFLFNGSILRNDTEKNISEVGIKKFSVVTVVDKNDIIKKISSFI